MAVRRRRVKNSSSASASVDPVKSVTMQDSNYGALVLALALLVCGIHWRFLSALHENDLYFSHLSTLERELSFRTEMGLYYSYYKTIVSADSLISGISALTADNVTEYPSIINTLARFNLMPEVVLGTLYRAVSSVSVRECLTISRGHGQSSVQACNGYGDPVYFYVNAVFALNGLLPASLFLLAVYISHSVWGGCVTVLMFLFNHTECTRVMWTPPLRESFAMPLIMLQLLALSNALRRPSAHALCVWCVTTVMALLPWQFTPLVLATQTLCLCALLTFDLITTQHLLALTGAHTCALFVCYVLGHGSETLLSSLFAASLLATIVTLLTRTLLTHHITRPLVRCVPEMLIAIVMTCVFKILLSKLLNNTDNAHIGSLLLAKLTLYKDFHTQLYLCSKEFDFLPLTFALYTSLTLLLPIALVVIATRLWNLFKALVKNKVEDIDTVRVYHILQCLWFIVMATLIMRLKVFLTPHLALLSSLVVVSNKIRGSWLLVILLASSLTGVYNMHSELSVVGEYNNPSMEELVTWVNKSTNQNAVFAGAMPTMATIKLVTGRAIVNHPHYENTALRARTKLVYSVYGHAPPTTVLHNLHILHVSHVIIEGAWCHKSHLKHGCSFSEVWSMEEPEYSQRPLFCDLIGQSEVPGFNLVFRNTDYTVLELH